MISDTNGPLPPNWEVAYSDNGEKYFVNHNMGTTQWDDPRDLPKGWEKAEDSKVGTFYVDHVNKTTQHEKPSTAAVPLYESNTSTRKKVKAVETSQNVETSLDDSVLKTNKSVNVYNTAPVSTHYSTNPKKAIYQASTITTSSTFLPKPRLPPLHTTQSYGAGSKMLDNRWNESSSQFYSFTTDPAKLNGRFISTSIIKGPKGFGFSLIGNDSNNIEPEFIQIKNIIPGGPADANGVLKSGDVLVSINDQLMLGAHQNDVIKVCRSLDIGEAVNLEICRGYALNIPANNKVITENVYATSAEFQNNYQYIPVNVTKNHANFGFTITDTSLGHQIANIHNFGQCPELHEGDVILEVDGEDIQGRAHHNVIRKLQEIQPNTTIGLVVKRMATTRHRSRTPTAAFRYGEGTTKSNITINPRSKTPAPKGSNTMNGRRHYDRPSIESINASSNYQSMRSTRHEESGSRLRQSNTTLGFNNVPSYVPLNNTALSRPITVNLMKKPDGFGFRLTGGSEANLELSVSEIVKNGAAELDGRLRVNDVITQIDNTPVIGFSHSHAVNLIKKAAENGHIKLLIKRNSDQPFIPRSASLPIGQNLNWEQQHFYDVTLVKRDEEEFGCVIVSLQEMKGKYIGNFLRDSPSVNCGKLFIGDHVVAVNGIPTYNLSHAEAISLFKNCGNIVILTIDPKGRLDIEQYGLFNDNHEYSQKFKLNNDSIKDGSEYDGQYRQSNFYGTHQKQQLNNAYNVSEERSHYESNKQINGIYEHSNYDGSTFSAFNLPYNRQTPEERPYSSESLISIKLAKSDRGFGFSIRGGWEFMKMPLYILKIAEVGPAAADGRLRVADQIREINGFSTKEMTHARAIELIKDSSEVTLLICRKVFA
uniref:Membrane-associated guanylate kinase, WW and PDZ domain-containing protein 1 n=1 Tax=Rhabditophanes sp. KR3021 TaxID=114890 RepID=A0AC35U436_9BILA